MQEQEAQHESSCMSFLLSMGRWPGENGTSVDASEQVRGAAIDIASSPSSGASAYTSACGTHLNFFI